MSGYWRMEIFDPRLGYYRHFGAVAMPALVHPGFDSAWQMALSMARAEAKAEGNTVRIWSGGEIVATVHP